MNKFQNRLLILFMMIGIFMLVEERGVSKNVTNPHAVPTFECLGLYYPSEDLGE